MLRSIISSRLFVFLLIWDLIFVIIHCFHYYGVLVNPIFSIEVDGSLSEWFQYLKELSIIIILFLIYKKYPSFIYLSWTLLFAYLLMDDSLQIHESLGKHLRSRFQLEEWYGLRPQDIGELIVSGGFGFLLMLLVFIGYRYANRRGKELSHHLGFLVSVLIFFGVFVDMIHVLIPYWKGKIGILEDGGEMIVMSALWAYVTGLKEQDLIE